MKETRYLDDLAVGQRYTSGTYEVTEIDIIRFAAEFDPQPFHVDAGAARDSVFGGLVASGWHTAAITMRLLVPGELQLAGGLVGLGGEARWPNPTRPGDVLQVHSEITALVPSRSRPDVGIVTLHSETRNQRGEIAQVLDAKLLVPRQGRG